MLYTRHLGFKNAEHALADGEPKALELEAAVNAVEDEILGRADIKAARSYNFSRRIPTAIAR